MRTSLASLASRPGNRVAATLALLLLLLPLSGCEAEAGAAERPVEGLLLLTQAASTDLAVLAAKRDSDEAVAIGLPPPAPDATWVAAGRGGVLVASTASGELITSDPVDPRGSAADLAGLEWRPIEAADEAGPVSATPAWLPAWDPGGKRFAALGGDLLGGGEVTLLLIDQEAGKMARVALKRPLLAAAPVWLDDARLALLAGSPAEPTTVVVDTTDGKVTKGPAGERRLATSGDGRVIAGSAGPGTPIVLRSSKAWLADDGTSIGSVEVPNGFTEAIALALDGSGQRLAIVWLGDDGTPRFDIHDGADGWRRVWDQPLPGSSAAAVAWLR